METEHPTKAQVVSLLRYRQDRVQRRLDFGDFGGAWPAGPKLAVVRPFRPLTDREIEHRERMVQFLTSSH